MSIKLEVEGPSQTFSLLEVWLRGNCQEESALLSLFCEIGMAAPPRMLVTSKWLLTLTKQVQVLASAIIKEGESIGNHDSQELDAPKSHLKSLLVKLQESSHRQSSSQGTPFLQSSGSLVFSPLLYLHPRGHFLLICLLISSMESVIVSNSGY